MKRFLIVLLGVLSLFMPAFSQKQGKPVTVNYDMRDDLSPKRLAIAMWDFSWLFMHYKGGAFENFDKVTNELLERGFNTVRIDAFPLIIGELTDNNQQITIPGDPLRNWGQSDIDRPHKVISELLEFMEMTKRKKINVILSTWNQDCKEFSDVKKDFNTTGKYWKAWDKVLTILEEKKLLDHVCYVDLDQEFPYFSPFISEIDKLGKKNENGSADSKSVEEAMNQNQDLTSNINTYNWNPLQMSYVKSLLEKSLWHFQEKFPKLRFTYSLTSYWEEIRALKINAFDVLELHLWMSQDVRFSSRSTFDSITKDRGKHDYADYMNRINNTMASVRPMMLKGLHNRLAYAKAWSEEIGAPLTTTEAWGPWWHMDSKDLDWKWLYDWCEQGMDLAGQYGMLGATPWNYSHPYWENWKNIQWYKRVNSKFIGLKQTF